MNTNIQPRVANQQHKAYQATHQKNHAQQQRHTANVQRRHIETQVANQVAFGKSMQTQHKLNVQA
jgi:hypothetical protein